VEAAGVVADPEAERKYHAVATVIELRSISGLPRFEGIHASRAPAACALGRPRWLFIPGPVLELVLDDVRFAEQMASAQIHAGAPARASDDGAADGARTLRIRRWNVTGAGLLALA
jgi:hypothetical protein